MSKAFDWLSHELLLVKLHAHGFCMTALRLAYSYLKSKKQRTKIISAYSSWEEILFGVPQGSNPLGPLLLNIFLWDLFNMMSDADFASYADDKTPYVSADTIDEVMKKLQAASVKLFKWLAENQIKANQDIYHLIVSKNVNASIYIGPFEMKITS